jgi:hypothetical protein
MTVLGVFPRQAANLVLHPRSAWQQAPVLTLRSALTWQLAGGVACLTLLVLRAAALAATHPAYRGAGGGILVGAAVAAQMLGYFLYLPLGAWVAAVVLRAAYPDLRFSSVFELFSYSTVPLLIGWVARTVVAWARPAPAVATAGSFHDYVANLWTALELRADPLVLLGSWWSAPGVVAGALGLFWIWHAVVLWFGLETGLGVKRRWALAVVATLFGVLLVASLAAASVGAHWHELVVWKE